MEFGSPLVIPASAHSAVFPVKTDDMDSSHILTAS